MVENYVPPKKRKNDSNKAVRYEEKSVASLQEIISRYCKSESIVVDWFIGSGTTAEAAILLKHKIYGCDSDVNTIECTQRIDEVLMKEFIKSSNINLIISASPHAITRSESNADIEEPDSDDPDQDIIIERGDNYPAYICQLIADDPTITEQ